MTTTPPRSIGLVWNLRLLWFTRHWLTVALTVLGVYVALPVIAPTLMKVGATAPAQAIYTAYRPFCHQFGFRTFFLYGEQAVYPLAPAAAVAGVASFESYIAQSPVVAQMRTRQLPQPPFSLLTIPGFYGISVPDDITPTTPLEDRNFVNFQLAASAFVGNPQMGYKMTLCERDIAIYGAMWGFGVVYSRPAIRRRLRPVPLLLYFWLGVLPIAIDGFSQLLGYPPANFWAARETLPVFRVLTGALFGAMTGWLGFTYIEQSMRDAMREVEAKLRAAGIAI
ncbi:MAG: DUF2085 domain-containing protein [Armatimonadetes bacterium]|nr:DUF2085 domain-containing protein [Anaerolineae bacterium]